MKVQYHVSKIFTHSFKGKNGLNIHYGSNMQKLWKIDSLYLTFPL